MKNKERQIITIETTVNVPVEKTWEYFNDPLHIVHWNAAMYAWHSPQAVNDLKPGGKFSYRMEARDGSMGFDFSGEYLKVVAHKEISFLLDDSRKVDVFFIPHDGQTMIKESFEAEETNDPEMQRAGWQSILSNFSRYAINAGRMKRLNFSIRIQAPAGKVYHTMLGQDTYNQWTAVFNPTSRYEGSWAKGSEIRFLGTEEDGTSGGMLSRIAENIPERFVSIEHFGIIRKGERITSGPEVEAWAGGLENYIFTPVGDATLLDVQVDAGRDFTDYMQDTYPRALEVLKNICEQE